MKLQAKFLSILVPLILVPLMLVSFTSQRVLQSNMADNAFTQTQILSDQIQWSLEQGLGLVKRYHREFRNQSDSDVNSQHLIERFHQLRPELLSISVFDGEKHLLASSGKVPEKITRSVSLSNNHTLIQSSSQKFVLKVNSILPPRYHGGASFVLETYLPLDAMNRFIATTRQESHILILLESSEGEPLTQERTLIAALKNAQAKAVSNVMWNNKSFISNRKSIHPKLSMLVLTPALETVSSMDRLNSLLSYIAIAAGLLSIMILHKTVTSWVTNPLGKIQQLTSNITDGELEPVEGLNRKDEIGDFAQSFDEMRRHLLSTTQQIQELAYYDTLTGLPNKVTFIDSIQKLIEKSTLTGHQVAILFFDLDNFKHINDGLGHETGDSLLMQMGTRLKQCIRSDDLLSKECRTSSSGNAMVARLGGDEFTLALSNVDSPEEVSKIANRVIERLSKPFLVNDNELFVSASIGISMYPKDGFTPEALLKNADTAMYAAKSNGKNNFHFYNANMNKPVLERIALESSMRCALENNEFLLHFQPKVPLNGNDCYEFETLMRWHNAEKGMISPGLFIPLAEDTGYIHQIGDWVIEQCCKQIEEWNDQGLKNVSVSLNLSPVQLNYGTPLNTLKKCLQMYRLDPSQLEVEITESGLMQNEQLAIGLLDEIKSLGVRIALDDFGTGYSSMAYLLKFPIDTLKIDRAFIKDIETNDESLMVLDTIIELAKKLKLQLVAEGVETQQQLALLQTRNCDFIQGFYFSKPLVAEQAMAFFQQHFDNLPQAS